MFPASFLLSGLVASCAALATSPRLSKREEVCSNVTEDNPCEIQADGYLNDICRPFDPSSGLPDMDAPCNIADYLNSACIWGAQGISDYFCFNLIQNLGNSARFSASICANYDGDDPDLAVGEYSNTTQRDCICSSQFWPETAACYACYDAHGAEALPDQGFAEIQSISSAYCAASMTPTLNFNDFWPYTSLTVVTTVSSFNDPAGNDSAISIYATMHVTGSAALDNIVATATASSTITTFDGIVWSDWIIEATPSAISLSINSAGQIVPTASSNVPSTVAAASASTITASHFTTTHSGGAGKETAMVARVMMLAGVAAFL